MILTSNDAANALLITPDVVRKMVKCGEISISRQSSGGNYEFSLEDIRAFIKNEDHKLPCSVISFANITHSTGKTMFTICIAEVLNYLGYRVLVIDCDKQGDTSRFFSGKQPAAGMPSITDIFYGSFPDNLITLTPNGVDLITSNLQHAKIHTLSNIQAYTNLKDYIDKIKANYDFILLDTPPDTGLPVLAPLLASDRTFCIITPEPSSFEGIDFLYTDVNEVNKTFSGSSQVVFQSCILNFIPTERKTGKNGLEEVREKGVKKEKQTFNVFYNYIPESTQYRQFYLAGARRENPATAYSFFTSPLAEKYKNSFVYVTLEMMAELREHVADKIRLL